MEGVYVHFYLCTLPHDQWMCYLRSLCPPGLNGPWDLLVVLTTFTAKFLALWPDEYHCGF